MAEITYAVVLLDGATRVDLRILRGRMQLPGRLLSVAILMIGTRLSAASVLFMVVAGQDLRTAGASLLRIGLLATVLLGIVAHGLTAAPGIKPYARQLTELRPGAPEFEAASGMQTT